jgi:NAD(P)-dependent dehydrogenase (short-subunit alcohol dehydrogenase family)
MNNGAVCLMTGASGGLGSVVLPMFLDAGYRVAAVAVDWPSVPELRPALLPMRADLAMPVEATLAVRKTLEQFGRLDCLVHLVGYFGQESPVESISDETWARTIDVNLRAAFHMIRGCIAPMRNAGGGRIVVVGSTAAVHPVVTWGAFSAAMAGLQALVQVASAELRKDNITVNMVNPSTISTPAVHASLGDAQASRWADPRRMGSLILWLCSEAGADVSGSSIAIPARQDHPAYIWPGVSDGER